MSAYGARGWEGGHVVTVRLHRCRVVRRGRRQPSPLEYGVIYLCCCRCCVADSSLQCLAAATATAAAGAFRGCCVPPDVLMS